MDYSRLLSKSFPPTIDTPPGATAETKYVFSITYTDPDTMPYEGLAEATHEALRREGRALGAYPPPQGHEGMRELIAGNLRDKRGIETGPDSIFLSSGAGGAIQGIVNAFIDPGDVVLAEEFVYLGTLNMLLQKRARVIHVPTDQDGMDTDALEATMKDLASQGVQPKMIYTISVYQNPMGMTLSAQRRKHMLEISHRYGVPILENESYADFRIDGDPLPPAMFAADDRGSVMYVSAYTKLLGCGLRLGYGVVPGEVRDALEQLRFGTAPSHLSSMTVHEYLRKHGDDRVKAVRDSLRSKRAAMLTALGEHFPPRCTWNEPAGGMMVWVRLPDGADTWAAHEKAVASDIKYNPGPVFRADRTGSNYLRLTYSHNTPEEIREGVALLAGVFEREGLFGT